MEIVAGVVAVGIVWCVQQAYRLRMKSDSRWPQESGVRKW